MKTDKDLNIPNKVKKKLKKWALAEANNKSSGEPEQEHVYIKCFSARNALSSPYFIDSE